MNATGTRVSGEFGTVEFHSRPKQTGTYKTTKAPSKRLVGTAITAQAAAPSQAVRERRARIEAQQHKPSPKPRRKVRTAKVRYVGYSPVTGKIGLEVKVRGLKADTYWLNYIDARNLWEQFSDEPLPALI